MKTCRLSVASLCLGSFLLLAVPVQAEIFPLFTEDFDAYNVKTDFGDGEFHGAEIVDAEDSPFESGDAMRIFDFNPDDKPELRGEFLDPLLEPFRVDFQSLNQSVDESKSAIRFRMSNAGKSITSESRVAFSLSWQADGKFTAKYDRGDGGVSTKSVTLGSDTVSDITMIANPAPDLGTYTYTLFDETRTLDPTSYDVYVDEFLLNDDFANGMPFTLTKSEGEYEPELGLQQFGLIGSSNADTDPDYLFDNILLKTGADIGSNDVLPVSGDINMDGALDAKDIDLLSQAVRDGTDEGRFDINEDGSVNNDDRVAWVRDVKKTWFGDSDLNGEFNSGDLVTVFSVGQYEDGIEENSTWASGDWSGDADFTSGDFVVAFEEGGYESGPRAAVASVPEPSAQVMLIFAALMTLTQTRNVFRIRAA